MIAMAAERFGPEHFGIGSDLCQDQPDSVVEWMRVGRWSKEIDYGEGSASNPGFPPQPGWFKDNRDFGNIRDGLKQIGFNTAEVDGLMGDNWLRFYEENFTPMP
jgi:microsomal dipeptidase-like Zn-dependent dipeptidase